MVSKMNEKWKETMTLKNLCLVEPKERAPKPMPEPARAAWEEYKEAEGAGELLGRIARGIGAGGFASVPMVREV